MNRGKVESGLHRVRGLLITLAEALVNENDEVSQAAFETAGAAREVVEGLLREVDAVNDREPEREAEAVAYRRLDLPKAEMLLTFLRMTAKGCERIIGEVEKAKP